jgi:hypothetical protein
VRNRFGYLAAAAAIAATVGAPTALADDSGQGCTNVGSTAIECSSPGNVEINDSPAATPAGFGTGEYGGPYPVPFDEGSR